MRIILRRLLPLAAVLLATALPAQAQTSDEQQVEDVVVKLFEAMAKRDTAAMSALFVQDARFAGVSPQGEVRSTTAADFMKAVAGAEGPFWIERTYDREIRVDGPIATAWTYYTLHLDERFSHCGYESFHLLKTGGAWKIVHLIDSRQREGCRHTEP